MKDPGDAGVPLPASGGRVVVVGAGMAGLTAAHALQGAGHAVKVVDKGRSVGGRLATRRIGDATVDHGAQFFTVRTAPFADFVDAAIADGVVEEWCRGFGPEADGHPRYRVAGGMNALAKRAAVGVDVRVGTTVTRLRPTPFGWQVDHTAGSLHADAVVLTAPVPQSLSLLRSSRIGLDDPATMARLEGLTYHPTLALLVVLDRPVEIGHVGAIQQPDGPFGFVADNKAKGVSAVPALTFHADHDHSRALWNFHPDDAMCQLLKRARPWLGSARVVDARLKRWRYAQPTAPLDEPFMHATVGGRPLTFAGDAFAGSKVEGAFTSGRAAALGLLGQGRSGG